MAQYDVVVKAVDQTKTAFRGVENGLKSIENRVNAVNQTLKNLGIGIAAFGTAATAALGAAARSAITFANEVDDIANATDISARAILGFSAAVQDAGGNSQKALDSILKLNQNISDAAGGSENLRKAFADVGVSLNDLARLSTEDLLGKVVQGLGQIDDKGRQAALAAELLGKGFKGVSASLVAANIGQFTQQATGAAAAQKKIADATAVLEQAFSRLRNRIAEALGPVADFITGLSPATLDRIVNAVVALGTAFVALGAAAIVIRTLRTAVLGLTAAMAALNIVTLPLTKFGAVLYTIAGGIAGIATAVSLKIGKSEETWDRWTGAIGRAYDATLRFFNLNNKNAPLKMTAADFQRTDKDTTPVASPAATVIREITDQTMENFTKAIATARKEYNLFLPLLASGDPAVAAAALEKVNAAAKTLADNDLFTNDLILRNFNQQIREQGEALRQQQVVYRDSANVLREYNLELSKQELELNKNAAVISNTAAVLRANNIELTKQEQELKRTATTLGDAATQQRVFNIELDKSRQATQQQVTNLELTVKAYNDGRISLAEYLKTLQAVDQVLLSAEQRQLQFNDAITKGMNDTAMTAQMAGKALADAYASGDIERFTNIYEQYKNVLGSTATGELALARRGAKEELQLTRDRAAALKTLTEEYKRNGGTGSAEYRKVAEALGMSTEAIDRMVNVHGSAIDRMVEDARFYQNSIQNAANTFSSEFTRAFMEGRNVLDSFRNFFSNIANDIANRIIKQQLADPIADALSGIVGKVIGGMGSGGGGGGGFFSSIISGVGGFLGDIFGGFFADGGMLGAGQFGVVGEAGPELITGPANITPIDDMKRDNGNLQVVFQIQAIDTQTGAQFLLQNKPLITSMITQAYNSRGRRGPLD